MRRRLAALGMTAGLIVSLILGLAACGDPDQQMLSEGARSAREAVSGVRTAQLAAQSLLDGRIWAQPATVMVTDAEDALGQVATIFEARQPETDVSRQTYDLYSEALANAADGVTELRIAVRSGDLETVRQQVGQLDKTAEQLEQLGERAQ
ncbi:hypothetical protein ACFPJ1_00250 [Kribbella qitaiheensis]|uniref:hypothetical protein n=1 Tax=Kribbella qitaiheensis TaxID=1544730 RepID=UPI0036073FD1